MYNGIGLATVRGSGTNGYVTKNLSFVSATRAAERKDRTEGFKRDIPQPKQPDQDIIEHNRKRDVEVKVLRLREALEDKGVEEAEIEAKTAEMRKNLLKQLPAPAAKRSKGANEEADSRGSQETHARAAAKESETKALKSALGIAPGYVAGSAFDRELQQKKRDERQEQREAEASKVAELEARTPPLPIRAAALALRPPPPPPPPWPRTRPAPAHPRAAVPGQALLAKERRREAKQQEKDRKRAEKDERCARHPRSPPPLPAPPPLKTPQGEKAGCVLAPPPPPPSSPPTYADTR